MTTLPTIDTERLRLRHWRESDRAPFAAMHADPRVTATLRGTPFTAAESDAIRARMAAHIERLGFGWWSVEERATETFVGTVGLQVPRFEAAFTPCVEVGWVFAFDAWGKGFATEAASAALNFGFNQLRLNEILAMTAVTNTRSQAVMKRLGMKRDPNEDFDHPLVTDVEALRRHVLYRMSAADWRRRQGAG